ncbi:hypothetical protein BGZ67_007513 [Mortierella alpina]|nr:hypothetical protein BGZ67_007513 [Mortierella alpina]
MINEYLNSTRVINLNTTDIDFEIPQQVFVYMVQTPSALPPLDVSGYDALRTQYSDLKAQYAALRDSQQEASRQQRSSNSKSVNTGSALTIPRAKEEVASSMFIELLNQQ